MSMSFQIKDEGMRIAGEKVFSDSNIEVIYPYTGEVIGSVPSGNSDHVKKAFNIAANYKSNLTRFERQKILFKIAEILNKRKNDLAPIITSELGISISDALYGIGRAYDVYTLAGQLCINDDGEIFSCDLTPMERPVKFLQLENL